MKTRDLLLLLAAGGLLYAASRRRKAAQVPLKNVAAPPRWTTAPKAAPEEPPEPTAEPEPQEEVAPDIGLGLTQHGFALRSWDRWMALGPAGFDAALNEGYVDPEEMVNEAFRKLYPDQEWPPKWGEPRYAVWRRIVYALESSTDKGHRGLHVVDDVS